MNSLCIVCGARMRHLARPLAKFGGAMTCDYCSLSQSAYFPTSDAQSAGLHSTETAKDYSDRLLAAPDVHESTRAGLLAEHRVAFFRSKLGRCPRILEVGCGSGVMGRQYVEQGCEYVGVDLDPRVVRVAKESGLDARQCDFIDSDLGGGFDVITASQVLEHITAPHRFMQSAIHHLSPRGVLHVDVPNQRTLAGTASVLLPGAVPNRFGALEPPHHCIGYTTKALRRLFSDYFDEIEVFLATSAHDTWGQIGPNEGLRAAYYAVGRALRRENLVVGVGQVPGDARAGLCAEAGLGPRSLAYRARTRRTRMGPLSSQ